MGRAPCCDKASVKKGPWSPEEDAKLKSYIEANGTGGNWIALPQKIGLKRCGKSCRLRWLNYLRPNIKHGGFSEEEDNIICSLYISIGSRWSIIAAQLPGRTDNDIKNYWNTRLKKKLLGKQRKEQQARRAAGGCNLMSGLKQQQEMMKREIIGENNNNNNYMISPGMVSQAQAPYWAPQLPAAVMPLTSSTNQEDQDSIRNLLVKLGGRFSDENPVQSAAAAATAAMINNNLRYPVPVEVSFAHQIIYDNSMNNMISPSSSSLSPINSSSCSEVINSGNMFQGLDGFPTDLTELIYGLDGGFYGTDHGSSTSGSTGISTSVESSSWGDINSLSYSQMVSGFEANCQQNMAQVQVSTFDESSYFGPQ